MCKICYSCSSVCNNYCLFRRTYQYDVLQFFNYFNRTVDLPNSNRLETVEERRKSVIMKVVKLLSEAVKAAAKFGAGTTSASFGYQPKAPECLRKTDKVKK